MNKYRLNLLTAGLAGFAINMVQIWYNFAPGIDPIFMAFSVAMAVTLFGAFWSFNQEYWKIGMILMGTMLISLVVPMLFTLAGDEILPVVKLITYIGWTFIPLVVCGIGLFSKNQGDNA